MNFDFEIAALFHSAKRWGKKGGNFKINVHLNSVELLLYCLCFRKENQYLFRNAAAFHVICQNKIRRKMMWFWVALTEALQILIIIKISQSILKAMTNSPIHQETYAKSKSSGYKSSADSNHHTNFLIYPRSYDWYSISISLTGNICQVNRL